MSPAKGDEGHLQKEEERELSFSKLDLPLFRGPFLPILHQNKARVGGWVGFSLNTNLFPFKSYIYHYACSTMFCMIWNGMSCQEKNMFSPSCFLVIISN